MAGMILVSLGKMKKKEKDINEQLNSNAVPFEVFGKDQIEEAAMHQMYQAARLPITVAGALMPDAHSGYGLPIGGVLATDNAVIPYGVGVDIGCRMSLSIFPIALSEMAKKHAMFEKILLDNTVFGSGQQLEYPWDHAVMEDPAFNATPILKELHGKAWKQLGSSGSGNHFVEFGRLEIKEKDPQLGVEPGEYLGLLSHSGSRALGANIANHYTRLAREKRRLPGEAAHLAWFSLDEEEGAEYWLAMNLAGNYAAACHEVIHEKISRALNETAIARVENHHNFAWKEIVDGKERIVHRKGATPAGKDILGVIPGSMVAPGYIVKGKGEKSSLQSASHGAGRTMSRSKAMTIIDRNEMDELLAQHQVTLIGGGLDEAPHAYKNIELVMESQQQLVDIVGKFIPTIVRMDGDSGRARKWK